MRSRVAAVALAWLGSIAPGVARSQVERPVHWTAMARHAQIAPGDTVRVALRASITEFFHLYSTTQGPGGPVRTTLELVPSRHWIRIGALRVPPPDTIPDGNFGIMSEVYDDSVSVGLTLRLTTAASASAEPPRVAVRFQACTTRYCLPARTDTVVVPVAFASASISTVAPLISPLPVVDSSTNAESSVSTMGAVSVTTYGGADGIAAFLLLAASMGALALLTPCVLPMIPITVTSFLAVTDDRRRGIARAGLYALGIVGGFTVLGVATAI
ncbi:MAG TPA: protein-disulfide reductase DsbD domain-containing protein, partial [Gemmatimonadaceae bacterium]|nr:protein-disulfide reductase DsbD domain-containing protein [Gemmatimonadaceae bacterium]